MKYYPAHAPALLDLDQVLQAVSARTWCEEGRNALAEQEMFTDITALTQHLAAVSEAREMIASGLQFPAMAFVSSAELIRALRTEGKVLDTGQFVRLYRLLKGCEALHRFFIRKGKPVHYPIMASWIEEVEVQAGWHQQIEAVLDLQQEIVRSDASKDLMKIRSRLGKLYTQKESVFVKALKHYQAKGWLADQKEGFREGRRVLAVLSEHKRQVQGMSLDSSGNGTITYIEPAEVVPIASEISGWELEERKELRKILETLSLALHPFASAFETLRTVVARLDAVRAKAAYAEEIRAICPSVTRRDIQLMEARNPVLEKHLQKTGGKIVPLDLSLGKEGRLLVISGPNAGGKSVAMKTTGLLQLMGQFGLHLPAAEGTSIGCFRQILVDIGDDQSIEDDLSTYSSHLLKMNHFLNEADADTLVLIDEMGSGTDPAYGGSIAEAVLEGIDQRQACGIVTTHYSNLKAYAYRAPDARNAAMSFNHETLTPTYQLLIGQAGASYALEIAQRSGLPDPVLRRAQELMGAEKKDVEKNLSQIQSEKLYLKGIRKNNQKQAQHLDKLVQDYERLKAQLEKQKKKLERSYEERLLADYNEANRQLENDVRAARNSGKTDQLKTLRTQIDGQRRKLADKLQQEEKVDLRENKAPILVGSRVRMEDSQAVGTVTELRKNKAVVTIGSVTTVLPLSRLIHVREAEDEPAAAAAVRDGRLEAQSQFELDLDIRGKYKDEAIQALESFLDRAVMFGIDRLRIIHGRGSGVLRQTVHQFLKTYPHVAAFSKEGHEAGGDGVTVVELA